MWLVSLEERVCAQTISDNEDESVCQWLESRFWVLRARVRVGHAESRDGMNDG